MLSLPLQLPHAPPEPQQDEEACLLCDFPLVEPIAWSCARSRGAPEWARQARHQVFDRGELLSAGPRAYREQERTAPLIDVFTRHVNVTKECALISRLGERIWQRLNELVRYANLASGMKVVCSNNARRKNHACLEAMAAPLEQLSRLHARSVNSTNLFFNTTSRRLYLQEPFSRASQSS